MSLDFDTSKIANREEVTTSPFNEKKWHPVTEALIWACLAIDIGKITKDNSKEFFGRLALWQLVHGAWLQYDDGQGVYLTQADVDLHIGLSTNVSNRTAKQFHVKLIESMTRDGVHKVKNRDGLSAHKLTLYRAHPELENIGSTPQE